MIIKTKHSLKGLFEHISTQEKINFTRHLAIVIKAGLPLFEGLKIIRRQVTSRTLKSVIDQVILDINNGQFLSDALERHNHLFGDFFINIIRIGETSGTLSSNLLYLAEEMKKSKTLKGKVRSALIYPAIILLATVGITSLLVFYVFPKILPVFGSLKVELPFTTRLLISGVEFLQAYWPYIVGGAFGFVILFKLLMRVRRFHYFIHRMGFYLPVFSKLTVDINTANFARVFVVLLKSGVKIVEALNITSKTFVNLVYQDEIARAAESVRKGEQFAAYIAGKRRFFPPLFTGLVEIGENTGNLEDNLSYLADYFTEEIDMSLKNLTALIEPLLLLFMGLVVGFVALSIITPIYSITQGIQ